MLPEDEKRLQRERDIYRATRGPDYSRLEGEIRRNKTEAAHKYQTAMAKQARERIPRKPDGPFTPPGNPEAARREA